QAVMIRELVEFFAQRRTEYPSMHVYHYNHTERSSLERLTRGTDTENLFNQLVDTGLFVDLFVVARNAVQVGTESYGLKSLERLTGFVRTGDIEGGAGAVVEYEEWMKTKRPQLLDDISSYNREDVQATKALRDWLLEQRPEELEWRDAFAEAASDFGALYGDRDFIANLSFVRFEEIPKKSGEVTKYAFFSWPEQIVD